MATIKYGHLISEARGKLNGTVFSRNAAGAFMRQKVSPVQPRTARQQQVRQYLSTASASWRTLTDQQRADWRAAAEKVAGTNVFGDGRTLTPSQLYTRLYRIAQEIGVTPPTTPPILVAPQGIQSLSITADTTPLTLDITFQPSPLPAGYRLVIDATDTLSAGISNAHGKFRRIMVTSAAPSSPLSILSAWQAKFGTLVAGARVFVRVYVVDESVLVPSPLVIASAIVQ